MKTEYSRIRVKRSDVAATVPTIPASEDITTFIDTDIFIGEFFYNTADNILYTRSDAGIEIISTMGGSYLPLAGGTMDSSVTINGTDFLLIRVADGTDESLIALTPTSSSINATDGTENASVEVNNQGRALRNVTKQDRFDLYPTVISGSLVQMVREVTTGYTALTTDDTPTNVGKMEVLSASAIYIVEVKVVGKETSSTNFYGATIKAIFRYNGVGTMVLIGTSEKFERSTFTTATSKILTDGDDVFIEVTGETGTDIQWTVTYKTN